MQIKDKVLDGVGKHFVAHGHRYYCLLCGGEGQKEKEKKRKRGSRTDRRKEDDLHSGER